MPTPTQSVRQAEVVASLCLATDLGMGFPFEHGLEATLTTMRLCEALGVDDETASDAFYACLLMYAGCNVDAEENTQIFKGSLTENHTHLQFGSEMESFGGILRSLASPDVSRSRRAAQMMTGLPKAARFKGGHFVALCEVAGMLAERLGVSESVQAVFPYLTERWDGKSTLKRAEGADIPMPVRIIQIGRDAAYQRLVGDDAAAIEVIRSRAGAAFDPEIVAVFTENAPEILGPTSPPESSWDAVLDAEPRPWQMYQDDGVDRALAAIGVFSDLVSPYLGGHCSGVSELAAKAAGIYGFDPGDVELIRRAGLVHDVGRTAVSPKVWYKTERLTADEREQVRLHPYQTERVLARSAFLSTLAPIAMAHHERVDGSGYHRGLKGSSLSAAGRLLATADSFHAKTEPRPYRETLSTEEAAKVLVRRGKEGSLDSAMVKAVVEAAGQPAPDVERPAGLTEREVEVIGLVARGLQTKQVARKLDISTKTADRHIQNTYRKIGVSSRAAATLFAIENGLVPR